jgi:DNA-directed DNA polymerase III PolC
MAATFARHHEYMPSEMVKEALDSTIMLAEQCTAKVAVDYHAALLPDPGLPEKYKGDQFAYLKDLVLFGWRWREMPHRIAEYAKKNGLEYEAAVRVYRDRLMFELSSLKRQKFVPYFLIVHDIYRFAREKSIMVGPGRGSVGGSLAAFLLGISAVDPLDHGLLFERFINPHRVDMPDIDMDFEDRRRQEVIEYIRQKYGDEQVSQIATVGKLSGKQCLRDVSRVLRVPLAEVNKVTNSIIERSSGDERASQTIEDSFKEFDVCRRFNKKYPDVLRHSKKLEGMAKNLGIHAAGVLASPVPLADIMPLEVRIHNDERIKVSAADMYGVAAAGLIKLDVLGLRTLTVLKECCEAVEERHGIHIDLESKDVDLNDRETLAGFTGHEYGGVFQYDTPSADKVCQGVNFTSFEDVAAMTALNRPGTSRSGLATKYVERKKKPKLVKKVDFHPKVTEITQDTLGIIVYQEHVIKIFTEIAGFPPGTADSLRKSIAKKFGDETIGKERENFIKGAVSHTEGMDEKTAAKIMDAITFFGSYGFNKSHATEYGMIAYWGMWLKMRYPLEFYWALLKNEPDRIRIQQLAKDAKRHKIALLPPHINVSKWQFSIDGDRNAIRGSLVDIKGVGQAASKAIIDGQPYRNLIDFADRVERRKCHRGVVTALALAGALEGMLPNVKHFVENIERWWKVLTSKRRKVALGALIAEAKAEPDYTEEERVLVATRVNPLAFGKHPIDAYGSFMKRTIKVPLVEMGGEAEESFFKDYNYKGIFIAGVIVEVKYNQVGDFHTGELPSEETRRQMFWGRRYANVNIEDKTGKQNRFKFDFDIFDDCREIIDKGIGTPLVVHAHANEYTGTLRTHFAADLEQLRKNVRSGAALTCWESVLVGRHPAIVYPWKTEALRESRSSSHSFRRHKYGGMYIGVVTHIRPKYDRKGQLMAFVGFLNADGHYIEVICFASIWGQARRYLKVGRLIRLEIEAKPDKRYGWSYFYNGGQLRVYRKKSALPEAAE